VAVRVDTAANVFDLHGDVVLRGGEIEYFNRTFYIREGRVVFDGNSDTFDPLLTVRAETRERDTEGEQVRITMAATNQRFSQFTATFSTSPSKSEAEIMALLGQMITGGDGGDARRWAYMGGNWLMQLLVIRRIENGLRDLLKFDIFSLRTMALQNLLENRLTAVEAQKPLAVGNFLDNTTVYIGKYFGSSIYVDVLMHFLYDESRELTHPESGGIIFQPEIGLELSSPFTAFPAIRWSLAPEIGNNDLSFIPAMVSATSITLSWKLSL
jgi:hypothetical protein